MQTSALVPGTGEISFESGWSVRKVLAAAAIIAVYALVIATLWNWAAA